MGINLIMGNLKRFRLKKLFKKIFGSRNDRLLSDYSKIVEEINLFEDQLKELSDEAIDELYEKDATVIDLIFAELNTLNGVGSEIESALAEDFKSES